MHFIPHPGGGVLLRLALTRCPPPWKATPSVDSGEHLTIARTTLSGQARPEMQAAHLV
jgi:hypothetical protein